MGDREILPDIHCPGDLKQLDQTEIGQLCGEIRQFLIENVSRTGGHLASNLGAVELTVAIHRVFDTAVDRLLFDVGHQCYVHKLLTGRRDGFQNLRKFGGMSGFPKPGESIHDAFVAGHASTAVSLALGMARARTIAGDDYSVLALVGDGALSGGAAYEALDDAGASGEPLIVILNDNGMSITRSVGGVATHLARLRMKPAYRRFKRWYRRVEKKLLFLGRVYRVAHKLKQIVKSTVLHSSMFEDMGLEYLGPIDGHDEAAVEYALNMARDMKCPVVVHVITKKGKGYAPAEANPNAYHGVSMFDVSVGAAPSGEDFSAVFGKKLSELASRDGRICAVTAAMETGTGLGDFSAAYPERFFDVGIAEGHAVSMTAGLAARNMLPVVAIYSTFLQRAYDMLLEDVALGGVHAVIAVDRSGIVGADGETHQGLYDTSFLCQMPGVQVWAPASYRELEDMLEHAVFGETGPVAVRYPRGREGAYRDGGAQPVKVLREGTDCAIVTVGILVNEAIRAAELLEEKGISASVVKLGKIRPIEYDTLLPLLRGKVVAVMEENQQIGGIGERIGSRILERRVPIRGMCMLNTGDRFLPQGTREELLRMCSLDAESAAETIIKECTNGRKTTGCTDL